MQISPTIVIAHAFEKPLSTFPKLDSGLSDCSSKLFIMKRCCHTQADDKATSSLNSVPFLTNVVNKFTINLKCKWMKTVVNIRNTSDYLASFKDFFFEEQAHIANSKCALKLLSSSFSNSDLLKSSQFKNGQSKASKAITFQTLAKIENLKIIQFL